jgi:Na+/melibiose symporter-like transporter
VLAVGAVHLQQYVKLYSAIPTIGPLFLLTFAGATVIGLALLVPLERWIGRRKGWIGRRSTLIVALASLGGIALASVTFALLLVAEHMPLFGFQEPGYDPAAIAASQGAEIATVLFLGTSLVWPLVFKSHPRTR